MAGPRGIIQPPTVRDMKKGVIHFKQEHLNQNKMKYGRLKKTMEKYNIKVASTRKNKSKASHPRPPKAAGAGSGIHKQKTGKQGKKKVKRAKQKALKKAAKQSQVALRRSDRLKAQNKR